MSITARIVTPAIPMEQSHSPRLARRWLAVLLGCSLALSAARAQQPESRPAFRVKYIADGAVYLEGGSGGGRPAGPQARGIPWTKRRVKQCRARSSRKSIAGTDASEWSIARWQAATAPRWRTDRWAW